MKKKFFWILILLLILVLFIGFSGYSEGTSIGTWGRNRTINWSWNIFQSNNSNNIKLFKPHQTFSKNFKLINDHSRIQKIF